MRRNATLVTMALLVAACTSSTPGSQATTMPSGTATAVTTTTPSAAPTTTSAATTVAPATTAGGTTLPGTSAATTGPTAPGTVPDTTTAPCPVVGTVDRTNVDFPNHMSDVVGADIRTGARPCYERIVVEFKAGAEGAGLGRLELPGYQVVYTRSPVTMSPIGEPRAVRGKAVLVLSFGAWMRNYNGDGYGGPTDISPTNVVHIRELLMIEDYEGQSAWAIGVDAVYPYVVFTLDGPPRIVIDLLVS